MSRRTLRVLIIEHHMDVRFALNYLLTQQEDIDCVGEADNVIDLISQLTLTNADFILLDWDLLEMDHAKDLVTSVKSKPHKPKIIAMSMNERHRNPILALGIDGFVNKRESLNLLETLKILNTA